MLQNSEPVRGVDPYDAVQECLENAVGHMRMFQSIADELDPETELWRDTIAGRLPHEAIRALERTRIEVNQIAAGMIKLGLDERRQKVDEAKVAMLGAALALAADDAGLGAADKRKLGAALRSRLAAAQQQQLGAAA